MKKKQPREFTAWIALSAKGYPAAFLGYGLSRKHMQEDYRTAFGGSIKEAGYRLVKVRMLVETP